MFRAKPSAKYVPYLDSSGNDFRRATYESLLAKCILDNSRYWEDVIKKINSAIIKLIQHNSNNTELCDFFRKKYAGIPILLEKLVDLESKSFSCQFQFGFYKVFFEKLHMVQVKPGSLLSQDPYYKKYKIYEKFFADAYDLTRPWELFHEDCRGRIETGEFKPTFHAGILSARGTPKVLFNFFSKGVYAGRFAYRKDPNSWIVKSMSKHNLPFCSGPSGTLSYLMIGIFGLFGDRFTQRDWKKFLMAVAAQMVLEGHHSFADVGVVIDVHRNKMGFGIKPDLPAKEYYDQFLDEDFRCSDEYHQFYTQHHLNRYSAMTWECLRDSLPESEDSLLDGFCELNADQFGEMEVKDLESLKTLLKEDEKKSAVTTKISEKLAVCGIFLEPPKIDLSWKQLYFCLLPLLSSVSFFAKNRILTYSMGKLIELVGKNLNKKMKLTESDLKTVKSLLLQAIKEHDFKELQEQPGAPMMSIHRKLIESIFENLREKLGFPAPAASASVTLALSS